MSTLYTPGGSDSKESACNAGDPGSIPELGRSPGEFHGQSSLADYSPWGCKESDMTERLTLSLYFSPHRTDEKTEVQKGQP